MQRLILFILICLITYSTIWSQGVIQKGDIAYLSHKIVIKLKDVPHFIKGSSGSLPASVLSGLSPAKITNVSPRFQVRNNQTSTLDNIFSIEYSSNEDPLTLSAKLKNTPGVLWAEPHYVQRIDFVPNDPSYSQQYNLAKINAEQAWEISKGDPSVIIGIIDTGVDWDHPDLAANIWTNTDEIPGNGIDDDNNGYIDDIRGWDFGGLTGIPDNDPKEDDPYHGTHVAGIASAVTNNTAGVAGIGYNCKVMPVKVAREDNKDPFGTPYISYGNDGIIYAVDNGARVINCSFGGSGFSNAGQDVIDYAVSKGVLVVAAAGNGNQTEKQYPADYDGVLSVGSTNSEDKKVNSSDYRMSLDVCSPGNSIFSTWQDESNPYTYLGGTSMASPLAAGLAGLVISVFPNYSAEQIAEQIRVNCDDIYPVNPDPRYAYMLGKGRINAYKALSNNNSKSVRIKQVVFSDENFGDGDNLFEPGESITADIIFGNILSPTENLSMELVSKNNYATVENGSFSPGQLSTSATISNVFKLIISETVPKNQKLRFLFSYSDGSYTDFEWIEVLVNPTYATQKTDLVNMTITSNGNLGYNDYPNNLQGDGFKYKNFNHLFEGSFLIGNAGDKISDAARSADQDIQSKDFGVVKPFQLIIPGAISDEQGKGIFNDDNANNKLGFEITLNSYSYSIFPYNKFIILQYVIRNKNTTPVMNVFAGLFFDWDMIDGTRDMAKYDENSKLSYIYNTSGSLGTYVGAALLTEGSTGYYAIQNDGMDGGFGIYDGFTDEERFQAISNGISKTTSGPGDVSTVISGGPYIFNGNDTIIVAFAIAAGDSLPDLVNSINLSRQKYQQILTAVDDENTGGSFNFDLSQNYPNPFNPATNFEYHISEFGFVSLIIYDILGNKVDVLVNEEKAPGVYRINFNAGSLASGVYFYKLQSGSYSATKKFILMK